MTVNPLIAIFSRQQSIFNNIVGLNALCHDVEISYCVYLIRFNNVIKHVFI